ncbi:MAG: hypothetical protein WD036_00145 [Bauldia sp.]
MVDLLDQFDWSQLAFFALFALPGFMTPQAGLLARYPDREALF